jgi:membrane protein CcdC involved in cytochrome C biogenesis
MGEKPDFSRTAAALVISVAVNLTLLVLGRFAESRPASTAAWIADSLCWPSGALVQWIVPTGHDAAHMIGAFVVGLVSSVVFYAVLAWGILAVLARLRRRHSE